MLETTRPETIEYEFVCHYTDGETMKQEYGTENEKNFGHIDQDRLGVFELTNGEKSYRLDLKNGMFDLNGQIVSFDLGFLNGKHLEPDNRRLIYFRRLRELFGGRTGLDSIRHAFGWQCTIDNENYQRIVFINEDGSLTFVNKK